VRRPAPLLSSDAVFLDFDGTLVELAERPALVRVSPQLPALLGAAAASLDDALAIVSGRRLASIDELLAPMRFAAAGLHGAELRLDPREAAPPLQPALREAVRRLTARIDGDPVVWLEDKGQALALHYRGAPQRAGEVRRWLEQAVQGEDVELIAGHCVFEARPRGIHKGLAVRRLMQQPPFAGRRPVYVGDDRTDEDGIAAAQALGGIGIRVGPGDSAAEYRLDDPAAVHAWLAGIARPQPLKLEERVI
jgi:trehalose 6-phosphate phosphatase